MESRHWLLRAGITEASQQQLDAQLARHLSMELEHRRERARLEELLGPAKNQCGDSTQNHQAAASALVSPAPPSGLSTPAAAATWEAPPLSTGRPHSDRQSPHTDVGSNGCTSSFGDGEFRQEVARFINSELRHLCGMVQSVERLVMDCRSAQTRLEEDVGRKLCVYEAKVDTAMAKVDKALSSSCRVVNERTLSIESKIKERRSPMQGAGSTRFDDNAVSEFPRKKLEKPMSETCTLDADLLLSLEQTIGDLATNLDSVTAQQNVQEMCILELGASIHDLERTCARLESRTLCLEANPDECITWLRERFAAQEVQVPRLCSAGVEGKGDILASPRGACQPNPRNKGIALDGQERDFETMTRNAGENRKLKCIGGASSRTSSSTSRTISRTSASSGISRKSS